MSHTICCICPTANRPELLGRSIACFERQTYEDRFLIIVDDLGQYDNQHGDRWQLVSFPRRILTLGEKNNVCAAMAPRDTWAYAKWDDDDFYSPWHLEALASGLQQGAFVQPRRAIDFVDGRWVIIETFHRKYPGKFAYHGCWGYTRELFSRFGGYRDRYAGDDGEFQARLLTAGVKSVDTAWPYPGYWYNRPLPGRISERGDTADVYFATGTDAKYVGQVPEWQDDSDWQRPVPTETIARPW